MTHSPCRFVVLRGGIQAVCRNRVHCCLISLFFMELSLKLLQLFFGNCLFHISSFPPFKRLFPVVPSYFSAYRADAVRAFGISDLKLGLPMLIAGKQRGIEGLHGRTAAFIFRFVNGLIGHQFIETVVVA